jgi:hypothetical protein
MNLFRSEEHARNWPGFAPGTEQGIVRLDHIVKLFSGNLFTRRKEPDYVSKSPEYVKQFLSALAQMGPFWAPPMEHAA